MHREMLQNKYDIFIKLHLTTFHRNHPWQTDIVFAIIDSSLSCYGNLMADHNQAGLRNHPANEPCQQRPSATRVMGHRESQPLWSYGKSRSKYIDGFVQDCSNSSALAMELLQSWAKQSTPFQLVKEMYKIYLITPCIKAAGSWE